ncbi:MAG: hypothetical protein L0215_15020 [Gemmataceae bacterium]|nr:hypothetical protein [Gemmataceae bacterium]
MRKLAAFLFWLALGLYLLSFLLPVADALTFGGGTDNGWTAFRISLGYLLVLFEGVGNLGELLVLLASLSNLLAWIAFGSWFLRKRWFALWAAYLAIVMAAPIQISGLLESRNPSAELFGPGYWVWLSSFAVLFVASGAAAVADLRLRA